MRLLELQLIRFGLFTNLDINFEADGKSFHVIFGSNEAGKSTALRAVTDLLFGIPERTVDDYVHKKSDLRIGARLEGSRGTALHVIRRKGRKKTLLDIDENPVEESSLAALLQGVSRELFEAMFGLSHEVLVNGGKDLLEGKGEVGESLFGASLGVRNIHSLRKSLREEAEAIFTPAAHKRPLNLKLTAFQEAKNRIRQLSLRPRGWEELQKKLKEAIEHLEKQEQEHRDVSAELSRLERLRRVLPQIRKREALLAQKSELDDLKLVPESSKGERTEAERILRNADIQQKKLTDEKDLAEKDKAALDVPEKLLAREASIEDLRDSLGAHKKASRDSVGLQAQVELAYQDARGILRDSGRAETLDEIDQLRIDVGTQARIRKLGQEYASVDTALGKAEKDLADAERSLHDLEDQKTVLSAPRDPSGLRRVVAEARKHGDLEGRLRPLANDISEVTTKAKNQLSGLSLWDGALEDVEGLPLPLEKTVERFDAEFHELDKKREHAEAKKRNLAENREKDSNDLVSLEARGSVPTEDELKSARAGRDKSWEQVRSVWIDGHPIEAETPEALAAEYESEVRDADDVADRLWRDADRVARYLTLNTQLESNEVERTKLDGEIAELLKNIDEVKDQWHERWEPAGIKPLPPGEMRIWLVRCEKLADSVAQLRRYEQEYNTVLQEIEERRDQCGRELAKLGEPTPTEAESLPVLLSRAEDIIKHLEDAERTRQQLLEDLEKASTLKQKHQREFDLYRKALEQWRSRWDQAVEPLGLDANALSEEAEAILDKLTLLFQKVDHARRDQKRIDRIKRDAGRFADQVTALVEECAPALAGLQPEGAAMKLIKSLNKGKDAQKDRSNLDKRLKQILKELSDLKREREGAEATMDRLMENAGCSTPEELVEVERRSREHREIASKLESLQEQLLGEGVPIDELLEQAGGADPDTLPTEIQNLEENGTRLARKCTELREKVWSLKTEYAAMDGGRAAADAATEAQEALAAIKHHVESYTRVKLAELLLDREIERYREENQGPILQRAGEMFRQITLSGFAGLTTGFDPNDLPILLCARSNGEKVSVDGLSDGTRDQLYLALRLASIEQHVARNESLPLIIDDALINFDDHRARATLELLSDISKKTQVLFFTHHTRLRELARDAVSKNLLKEHNLDQRNGARIG